MLFPALFLPPPHPYPSPARPFLQFFQTLDVPVLSMYRWASSITACVVPSGKKTLRSLCTLWCWLDILKPCDLAMCLTCKSCSLSIDETSASTIVLFPRAVRLAAVRHNLAEVGFVQCFFGCASNPGKISGRFKINASGFPSVLFSTYAPLRNDKNVKV